MHDVQLQADDVMVSTSFDALTSNILLNQALSDVILFRRTASRHQTGSDWTLHRETPEWRGHCRWVDSHSGIILIFGKQSEICVNYIFCKKKKAAGLAVDVTFWTINHLSLNNVLNHTTNYSFAQVKTSHLWLKWMLSHCWRNPLLNGSRGSGWISPASPENTCSWRKRMTATLR